MLVNQTNSRNWNAVSAINVQEDRWDAVMGLNASYNNDKLSFSENIMNVELYLTNKQAVDADIASFKESVWADIGE